MNKDFCIFLIHFYTLFLHNESQQMDFEVEMKWFLIHTILMMSAFIEI